MTVESLYPFLYADSGDPDAPPPTALLADLYSSTVEKAREVSALRRSVAARDRDQLVACAGRIAAAFTEGGRMFTFGNGGSSTDATDLAARFVNPIGADRALPAYSLTTDVAAVTALSNDVGFEVVFARQLAAFGRAGDVAVGISTSGGSSNLVRALEQGRALGMLTIGISGYSGGRMAGLDCIDFHFSVPSTSVHRIQEVQATIYHVLWELTITALGAT